MKLRNTALRINVKSTIRWWIFHYCVVDFTSLNGEINVTNHGSEKLKMHL
ncbi:MAG TPA: hypothetical protein PLG90_08645 [Ignavibacteria bacterium]|nr:hypothetical protein [Ignavibacteria bacterium]